MKLSILSKMLLSFVKENEERNLDMTTSGGKQEKGYKKSLLNAGIPELSRADLEKKYPDHQKWKSGAKVGPTGLTFFVFHPNSSQGTPDFYVVVNGVLFKVDLKSSKSRHGVWNSGQPKVNTIYVITTEEGNFLFLGQHLMNKSTRNRLNKLVARFKRAAKRVSAQFKAEGIPWNLTIRAAHNDRNIYTELNVQQKVIEFIEKSLGNTAPAAAPLEDDLMKAAK